MHRDQPQLTGVPRPSLGNDQRERRGKLHLCKTAMCKKGNKDNCIFPKVGTMSAFAQISAPSVTRPCQREGSKCYLYVTLRKALASFTLLLCQYLDVLLVLRTVSVHTTAVSFVYSLDMATHNTVQTLIKTRLTLIKEASERRDVDAVTSWYSGDATFVDPGTTRFPLHGLPWIFTHSNGLK